MNVFQTAIKIGASVASTNGKISDAKTRQDKIVGHKEH